MSDKCLRQIAHEGVFDRLKAKGLSLERIADDALMAPGTLYKRLEDHDGPLAKDLRLLDAMAAHGEIGAIEEILRRHGYVVAKRDVKTSDPKASVMGLTANAQKEVAEAVLVVVTGCPAAQCRKELREGIGSLEALDAQMREAEREDALNGRR